MANSTQIETKIFINAQPEQVWKVFTDFDRYEEWNPFMKSLKGDLKVGNQIHVVLDDMKFKPKVLCFEPGKELEWIGRLFVPGIFDGQHRFQLIDNGDGTTTFVQGEKFRGILAAMMKKKIQTDIKENFILMNEKLKERVETGG